jgi:hypothetical protein
LPFGFVKNNKTLHDLLNFRVVANQNSNLKIFKSSSHQISTTFTIDECNRIKNNIKLELLLQQESLNFTTTDIIWTSELL